MTPPTSRAARSTRAAPSEASLQDWARTNGAVAISSSRKLIVTALREAIVSGAIAEGEQLKQDELSAHFHVSPAPVREALRQLESEGLVEHYPNRGVFVTEVPCEEALGVLLPVRLLVENYALNQIVHRLDPDLIDQLQAQIATMQQGADTQDVAMINEADVRFHELAVEASGAHHAIQLWHSVLPRIRLQFYRLTPRHVDLQYVPQEHRVLLRALQGGDLPDIAAVLRQHIIGASSALMDQPSGP